MSVFVFNAARWLKKQIIFVQNVERNYTTKAMLYWHHLNIIKFWGLFISILILLTIGTIIIGNEFNKGTFSNYSTGMYSGEVFQLYEQSDDTWGIQCDKALSSGTFNHMISVDDFLPKRLIIESSSSGGTLILNVIQNDKVVNSFDISNTDGEKEYELVQLENEKIKLSVEHTKISNTRFKIRWE